MWPWNEVLGLNQGRDRAAISQFFVEFRWHVIQAWWSWSKVPIGEFSQTLLVQVYGIKIVTCGSERAKRSILAPISNFNDFKQW
jgi:hypothetical protein